MATAQSFYSQRDGVPRIERRRHRVYVTRNTEYHCRDLVCVAVRERTTGRFLDSHAAIGKHLTASVERTDGGGIGNVRPPDEVEIGDQLCFSSGRGDLDHDVLTSALTAIERPPKELVQRYATATTTH